MSASNQLAAVPWPTVPFSEAADDCTGGQIKIPRSEFQRSGRLPIIDQGQTEIAGYTDDERSTYVGPMPVVLFGDHTRAFKYADQPFALGADGIKALAPKSGFLAKFLFFYWLQAPIPSLGYSRHFRLVRELSIPKPHPKEQARIVEILDQADALRQQRADADAKLARLLPALFRHHFGDPFTNSKRLRETRMGDVIVESRYGLSLPANTEGRGIPMLRMNNVTTAGDLDLTDLKHVELSDEEIVSSHVRPGELLFNRTNSAELVGKTGLWEGGKTVVAASYLILIRIDETQVRPEFAWAWMNTPFFKQILLNRGRRAIGMANINSTELRSFPILVPALREQDRFIGELRLLKGVRTHATSSAGKLETLFQTLLHRAFDGSLTAKWRETHLNEHVQ